MIDMGEQIPMTSSKILGRGSLLVLGPPPVAIELYLMAAASCFKCQHTQIYYVHTSVSVIHTNTLIVCLSVTAAYTVWCLTFLFSFLEPLAKSEQISKEVISEEVIVEEVSVSHFLDHLDYEIEEVKDSGNNNNDNDRKNNDSDEDDDGNTNTNNNCNWNKYTPAMLRQPKSLKLRNKTPVSKKRNCDQYKENLSVKKNILSLQEEHLHMMIAEQKREDAFKEENRQYKRIEHQLKIAAMKEEYELAIKHRREEHNMKMELLKKGIWPSNQMNLPN
ncbi:uncharacterized SDCCAG3 family protein-like [Diaphorina citri]|uniref:Uncharacterized SDCCAG3 family protein-like n=1 Tax=Diaphorina citri TaxID=121845 RepID=A0A1S4E7L5_DIACI|nr:uncharacterized SDCCAG3 family protein-like [Diaphorina citri]